MVRSFRRNGRKPYGTGTSWVRHGHARRLSSNTAIASLARDAEPGTGDQTEDGGEVAEQGDGRGSEDQAEGPSFYDLDRGRGGNRDNLLPSRRTR